MPVQLSRLLPLAALAVGLAALTASLLPARADEPAPPGNIVEVVRYTRSGEYTVERRILINTDLVSDPEALADEVAGVQPNDGIATAEYKLNTHKWTAESLPVPVYYNGADRKKAPDAESVITTAIDKWNAVTPSKFSFTYAGTTTRDTGACSDDIEADGFNTVAYSSNLDYGILGSTCTLFRGPNAPIEEFDMELDSGTPWSTSASTPKGMYDIHSTMLHELGHAAGIGHPCGSSGSGCSAAEKAAVMFALLDDGEQRRTLTGDDLAALRAQYPGGPVPTPSPAAATPTPIKTVVIPPFNRDFQAVAISLARD